MRVWRSLKYPAVLCALAILSCCRTPQAEGSLVLPAGQSARGEFRAPGGGQLRFTNGGPATVILRLEGNEARPLTQVELNADSNYEFDIGERENVEIYNVTEDKAWFSFRIYGSEGAGATLALETPRPGA